jgi:hypothetical protein
MVVGGYGEQQEVGTFCSPGSQLLVVMSRDGLPVAEMKLVNGEVVLQNGAGVGVQRGGDGPAWS